MLPHSRKTFVFLSAWPGTEYTYAVMLKRILLTCLESYQGFSYYHTCKVDIGW